MFRPSLASTIPSLLTALALVGCNSRVDPPIEFEPNLVHSVKYQIKDDIPMEQATQDADWVVRQMFGTPDEPALPEAITGEDDLVAMLSTDRLMRASGPSNAEGRGLFRKHCAVCHGVTGNGRGETAAVQVPYPRDYRMGIFKFKSTPRGEKPTREDMAKLIRGGIAGTAMKPIPELKEEDIQALVEYVIYLSWRGEVERALVDDAVNELDLEGGDRLLNYEFATKLNGSAEFGEMLEAINEDVEGDDLEEFEDYMEFASRLKAEEGLKARMEEAAKADDVSEEVEQELDLYKTYTDMAEDIAEDADWKLQLSEAAKKTTSSELLNYENYLESWEIAEDLAVDIGTSWLDADEEVLDVPAPPEGLPLAESYEDVVAFSFGDQAEAFAASVKRGQELFVGKIASCSKCHGETGLGNGQTTDYDDWTKDWTLRVGIKPEDRDTLIPLLARGALPPRNALPRNFAQGVFRGGSTSQDLYRRIMQGIDGTPMPAATFVEGQFEQDDVWNLINFIRSLEKPLENQPVSPAGIEPSQTEPTAAEPAAVEPAAA